MRRPTILPLLIALLLLGACSSDSTDPPPAQTGTLQIRVLPAGIGADWTVEFPGGNVDGGTDDEDLADLAVGEYRVDFLAVAGYETPAAVTVQLTAAATVTATGIYTVANPITGSVDIDVTPDFGPSWILKVEAGGGIYDVAGAGDQLVEGLPPGAYSVDWQPWPDWIEPDGGRTDGELVAGVVDRVTGTFVRRGALEMEMVTVSAGTFVMGSQDWELGFDPDTGAPLRPEDEAPRHEVTLTRPLLVAATEITQGQYEAVMGVNPSAFGPGPNLPVERVTWVQAVQFCNTLSAAEGLTLAYGINGNSAIWDQGADGYRLPTEAEWEYLARAGRDEAFHFGPITEPGAADGLDPVLDRIGWYSKNADGATRPVATKLPNAWGVYDVHGNVLEWCWDRYDADGYDEDPQTDPVGPAHGETRVLRGGSYFSTAEGCRSAYRIGQDPLLSISSVGFRVVRNAP